MDLGVMAIKGFSAFPKNSDITGTSPSDCYPGHSGAVGGGLTTLKRSSRCIIQPQPNNIYIYIYIYISKNWITLFFNVSPYCRIPFHY